MLGQTQHSVLKSEESGFSEVILHPVSKPACPQQTVLAFHSQWVTLKQSSCFKMRTCRFSSLHYLIVSEAKATLVYILHSSTRAFNTDIQY